MEFGMFVSWVVVGLLAGWLAGFVMEGGGYGLVGDMVLGRVGSVVGGWIFRALGVSAGGGLFPTVFVAFVGAVIVLVAQRKVWAHASEHEPHIPGDHPRDEHSELHDPSSFSGGGERG